MRIPQFVAGAGIALVLTLPCAAQTKPASPASTPASLNEILQHLASDDFAEREAAQAELEKIPPDQLPLLEKLAATQKDPEVQARLKMRIEQMEACNAVHPLPLSLDLQDASLNEVAAALNKQLGKSIVGASSTRHDTFTLHATNQSFWEIVDQLNAQHPLNFITAYSSALGADILQIRAAPAAAKPQKMEIADGVFALSAEVIGQPTTGNWLLQVAGFADPRVKIVRNAQLQIDKITDQNGTSLLPLVMNGISPNAMAHPVFKWTSIADISPSPALQRIAEIRGSIALTLLVKETTVSFDLTQQIIAPADTSHPQTGVTKVGKDATGNDFLRVTTGLPADGAFDHSNPAPVTIRLRAKDGAIIESITTNLLQTTLNGRQASKLELVIPERTREVTVPVQFKNIDVPPSSAPPKPIP